MPTALEQESVTATPVSCPSPPSSTSLRPCRAGVAELDCHAQRDADKRSDRLTALGLHLVGPPLPLVHPAEQFPTKDCPRLAELTIERVLQLGYDYCDEYEFGLDLILEVLEKNVPQPT